MKTVFITGGSSGIGRAVIGTFEQAGWKVIAPTRKELNLADLQGISENVSKLTRDIQHIDAVVHVAGIWHNNDTVFAETSLENFTPDQIVTTMAVGVTGFMLVASMLLPKLTKDGAVVGISGTFGDGANGWLPYYTSKRALEDFLVGLSHDYPSGPRAYAVSPADTATPAYQKFYPEYSQSAQSPNEVADYCLKLVQGTLDVKSGEVIQLRDGKPAPGFHV